MFIDQVEGNLLACPSMRFIAFDLETTGKVPGVDRIVELGAVLFQDGRVEAVFSSLVDPRMPIPPGASAVNGITDEMVQGKPHIESFLEPLTEFCGEVPLVAHNAPFDAQFLIADYTKYEVPAPRGLIFDTLPMARKIFPGLANYRLGNLVQHLKLSSDSEFHRAEEDATYCGRIFCSILQKISSSGPPPRLENLVALSGGKELRFPVIEKQPKQLSLIY